MKITKFKDREEWLLARRGKITGSKVKDILVKRGNGEKVGYYQLIADKLAVLSDGLEDVSDMERGNTLEENAIKEFVRESGKSVNTDLVIFEHSTIDNIALSPDGYIEENGEIKEMVEIKCLSSARHIEALIKKEIPKEYKEQIQWYFIVNEDLDRVYMCFYDPRMTVHEFFYIVVNRSDYEDGELEYLETAMSDKLDSIKQKVEELIKGTDLEF